MNNVHYPLQIRQIETDGVRASEWNYGRTVILYRPIPLLTYSTLHNLSQMRGLQTFLKTARASYNTVQRTWFYKQITCTRHSVPTEEI